MYEIRDEAESGSYTEKFLLKCQVTAADFGLDKIVKQKEYEEVCIEYDGNKR